MCVCKQNRNAFIENMLYSTTGGQIWGQVWKKMQKKSLISPLKVWGLPAFSVLYHCKLYILGNCEVTVGPQTTLTELLKNMKVIIFCKVYSQNDDWISLYLNHISFVKIWYPCLMRSSIWMRLLECPQTGACLQHVRGGFAGGIREGESVEALLQGPSRLLLFSQDSASETENRWQREGGAERLACVFLLFCVCVYPRGVSIGYGYHIVHDITHVAAWCGSSICPALLVIVSSVKPNTYCKIQ